MFPKNDAPFGRAGPRHRRFRRSLIVAVSASLLGATAITTSASAANDGSSAAATSQAVQQAATSGVLQQHKPTNITGHADNGTPFSGTFTLQRFRQHNGALYAVWQLAGTLGTNTTTKQVSFPVSGVSNDVPTQGLTAPHGLAAPAQTAGACSVLNLHLGALDVNLLGLHVHLDPVFLLIEAIPGAGALLGNLLCSVAGLLGAL